ncbi:hypothetical protein EWM64_g9339 [Hericium alpestre]|uniref:Uncharacterized protein n=1 Tax=Hericium alpestre TaxID=135208 RepID=A0A4Y9ZJP8_9AGAM|nr:hypothetical protein EWM64_g9339 [Hericium alpestre]
MASIDIEDPIATNGVGAPPEEDKISDSLDAQSAVEEQGEADAGHEGSDVVESRTSLEEILENVLEENVPADAHESGAGEVAHVEEAVDTEAASGNGVPAEKPAATTTSTKSPKTSPTKPSMTVKPAASSKTGSGPPTPLVKKVPISSALVV